MTAPAPRYQVGTASWTDPTLLATDYYPSSARSAEARLRYYAERFSTVEVDSTYYALPSERNCALWAQRTPDLFQFHIKAFAALTLHAAETRSLPNALKSELDPASLRERRIDIRSEPLLDRCFALFRSALQPLRAVQKLGCILLQYPPWFTATTRHEKYIAACRDRLPDDHLAIEFRHTSWFNGSSQRTLDFLRDHHLILVVVDAPLAKSIAQPPFTATHRVAYVRLHGRNRDTWFGKHNSAADRFKYLYSDAELRDCAQRVRQLRNTDVVNVIFNNCYADYGVRNAAAMRGILAEAEDRPGGRADPGGQD